MKKIFTKDWWRAAGIRALKTAAQVTLSMTPAAVAIQDVDWLVVLGTAAGAAFLSLCTSLAGLPEVKGE